MLPERINIVIPLFNDWQALGLLLNKIKEVIDPSLQSQLSFLIVDDCSSISHHDIPSDIGKSLSIVRLFKNVGHQKAIVIGLSYLASQPDQYPTIVMDSDGEDRPEDIPKLITAGLSNLNTIVFAHRTKRYESLTFKLFYGIYKAVFRLLTGKVISFGNFSFIPAVQLRKLVHVSEIWNNYPGGVIRSRLLYTDVPIERGQRLAGESKMNFVSLILHGLSAVSVLVDTTAVRLALFSIAMATSSLLGIGVITFLHFFTDTVVPGWANYLVSSLFTIFLQAFLISLLLIFTVLSYRTQPLFIPAHQFSTFIEEVEKIY